MNDKTYYIVNKEPAYDTVLKRSALVVVAKAETLKQAVALASKSTDTIILKEVSWRIVEE